MYARNERNMIIVKNAWMIPHLPMCVVFELPDGSMKFWGVRQTAEMPKDEDIREYKGYHPSTIPTADKISSTRMPVFGLVSLASLVASQMGSTKSEKKADAARENGKRGGRPRKPIK